MNLRFKLIALLLLVVLGVMAQYDADYFLRMAKSKLKEGKCESAKEFYDVYKNHFHEMDASVESQIKKCGVGSTKEKTVYKNPNVINSKKPTPIRENYTETAFGINMKMIWVEGGDFMMGCTSEQSDCEKDEKNVRRVTLGGFYIGMLEVTQAQWKAVMGTTVLQQRNKKDSSLPMAGVGSNYPMYYVNYDEVTEFCRLLSKRTGKTYTLPTEAQWEYAARGGMKSDGTKSIVVIQHICVAQSVQMLLVYMI